MIITKEISENNELYLYMNEKLIYKRWLNTGQSKIFDSIAYDKYTYASYADLEVKNSDYIIYVKAKLRLKTKEEGGRTLGISNGYRPNHIFEYKDSGMLKEAFFGDIQIVGDSFLKLGKEGEVIVRFPLIQRIERFMDIGREWWIHESARQIGKAKIIGFGVS